VEEAATVDPEGTDEVETQRKGVVFENLKPESTVED
jgi:hypothetical protein